MSTTPILTGIGHSEGDRGVDSSRVSGAASALPGLTDPASLARLEEVARAADEAQRDNGHCGEGSLELRERFRSQERAEQAFAATFTAPVALRLLAERRAMVEALTGIRDGLVASRHDIGVDDWIELAEAALNSGSAQRLDGGEVRS